MSNYIFQANIDKFEPEVFRYSGEKALFLADCAKLSYEPEDTCRDIMQGQLSFKNFQFFSGKSTQAFIAGNDKMIIVSFRGTEMKVDDFLRDAKMKPKQGPVGKVHRGFYGGLHEVWGDDQENKGMYQVIKQFRDNNQSIWFGGHSLGAALATLAAAEYVLKGNVHEAEAVKGVYTIGQPRVGDDNFAEAFDVKFADAEGKQEYVWATSWGVSTRLMGALVMTHSDDAGLVLPPKLAPIEVVIVPIYKGPEQMDEIVNKCREIESELREAGIRVKLDADDSKRSGWKFAEYELKGVPLRLAVGPRDLEKNSCELARRDTRTKSFEPLDDIVAIVQNLLETIQSDLYNSASERLTSNTIEVDTWDDFTQAVNNGKFVMAHWDGTSETEDLISQETKASIRCLPLEGDLTPGTCVKTGNPSSRRVLFARAY